jgi:hypothetical protein
LYPLAEVVGLIPFPEGNDLDIELALPAAIVAASCSLTAVLGLCVVSSFTAV